MKQLGWFVLLWAAGVAASPPGVTLGEISGEFREVWGSYRPA